MDILTGYGISTTIDIVVAIFVAIIAFFGFYRGFFKTLFSTCSWFLSLICSILLASFVAKFLESSFSLATNISNGLNSTVSNIFPNIASIPISSDVTQESLISAGVPSWIASIVISAKSIITIKETATVGNVISSVLAYYIVIAISVIILFILFKIIFYILGNLIKKAHKFKTFGTLDKVFGIFLGIVEAFIIIDLLIFIISVIPLEFCQKLMVDIENAPFTTFIDKINLFQIIWNNVFGTNGLMSFITKMLGK